MKLPVAEDSALLPSLLTLSDVFPTGHHAAVTAGVGPRTTVTVIGDGAVGLWAVLASRRLGAERIILMGRHKARTDLGVEFGATDVVAERGKEGVEKVREAHRRRRHAHGAGVRRHPAGDRGVAGRGPQRRRGEPGRRPTVRRGADRTSDMFMRNVTLTGGVAPARAYIEELLPDVLDGKFDPGRVFDRTIGMDEVPDGYRAMDAREALKVLIRP